MIAHWNLMPWMIVWAIVTTAVLVLAFYRLRLVAHEEPGGVHVLEKPEVNEAELALARKLLRVDFYGKALTVASAVLIVAIGVIHGYQAYLKAYEVVGH
jgi:hypothetical protein